MGKSGGRPLWVAKAAGAKALNKEANATGR